MSGCVKTSGDHISQFKGVTFLTLLYFKQKKGKNIEIKKILIYYIFLYIRTLYFYRNFAISFRTTTSIHTLNI